MDGNDKSSGGKCPVLHGGNPNVSMKARSNRDWWHPGRSARLQLGPKNVMVEFGELHPRVLKALDADAPMLAFEIVLDNVPEPRGQKGKNGAGKARGSADLSAFMPLTRFGQKRAVTTSIISDFAFQRRNRLQSFVACSQVS